MIYLNNNASVVTRQWFSVFEPQSLRIAGKNFLGFFTRDEAISLYWMSRPLGFLSLLKRVSFYEPPDAQGVR